MGRLAGWGALCVIPLVGLLVLLAEPSYDLIWENHPAHFWLVVLVGATLPSRSASCSPRRPRGAPTPACS